MSLADDEKLDREIDRVAGQVLALMLSDRTVFLVTRLKPMSWRRYLYPEIKRLRQRAKVAYLNEIGERYGCGRIAGTSWQVAGLPVNGDSTD